MLTETDAPYLSAEKNGRSEPSHIKETVNVIAKIKKITIDETEKIIFLVSSTVIFFICAIILQFL